LRNTPVLRDHLTALKATTGREGHEFVFGVTPDRPFTPSHIRRQAAKAWEAANTQRAEKKLEPLYAFSR
jgi:hypothetical protein